MILAGVLLKTGAYGFLRISHRTLPGVAKDLAFAIAVLGVFNIIYAALVALAQTDMKRLVAYSSIAHMGFVLLGVAAATPMAINGAVYQMISHGVISPMMFFMVGVFYHRVHTRDIPKLGGLYVLMPAAAVFLMFATFANLGLPGLSGFIAEFFTLAGTLPVYNWAVYASIFGIIVVGAYNLWLLQRVLMGDVPRQFSDLTDIKATEKVAMVPLMAATLIMGLLPSTLLHILNESVVHLSTLLGGM